MQLGYHCSCKPPTKLSVPHSSAFATRMPESGVCNTHYSILTLLLPSSVSGSPIAPRSAGSPIDLADNHFLLRSVESEPSGAAWRGLPFSFVTFLLGKQKKSKSQRVS